MEYKFGETLICLDKVELSYGEGLNKKIIISDFSMIEKDVITKDKTTGQIIAVLGPSGSGKSTLFKAITGLLKPSAGKVLINDGKGQNSAKEVVAGDVGFIDQKYTLFRHKTIYEILDFATKFGKYKNLSKQEKQHLIFTYLTEWGLYNQKDQYSFELSGGQRQRVAILEKIISSKGFIVMDEPASGLDVKNIEKLKHNINLLASENDTNTIIMSTHDINLAVEMADSIYIIGHKNTEDLHSTLLQHFDLKEMGLAWKSFNQSHLELSQEIKKIILNS